MIPVMVVPVLNRYDLLERMLASIDVPLGRLYIVDNGGQACPTLPAQVGQAHLCRPGANLGVAASWNLGLKANIRAPWWMFVNVDIVFEAGALARLAEAMVEAHIATLMGYGAFAIDAHAVETVGFFDEAFHPIYFEDSDWDYRARLKGLSVVHVHSETRHETEATIKADQRLAAANRRTLYANRERFERKWGGNRPGSETFLTPFDAGYDPTETTAPPLSLLREQGW